MHRLALLAVLLLGCSSSTVDSGTAADTGTSDAGQDSEATRDGGAEAAADGGGKAFGESCTADGECASNVCFKGGSQTFCSIRCTAATAAADCPKPPTDGTCNNQGYCKKP